LRSLPTLIPRGRLTRPEGPKASQRSSLPHESRC
jgi:hypothetical protein